MKGLFLINFKGLKKFVTKDYAQEKCLVKFMLKTLMNCMEFVKEVLVNSQIQEKYCSLPFW